MTDGRIQLARFIARHHKTQMSFAKRIKVPPSHVCNLLQGNKRPSLRLAKRIKDVAGIPMEAWV